MAWSVDGQTIVVANEGEPDDYYGTRKALTLGPISISVIPIRAQP